MNVARVSPPCGSRELGTDPRGRSPQCHPTHNFPSQQLSPALNPQPGPKEQTHIGGFWQVRFQHRASPTGPRQQCLQPTLECSGPPLACSDPSLPGTCLWMILPRRSWCQGVVLTQEDLTGGPGEAALPVDGAYGCAQGTEVVWLQCAPGGHPCKPEVYKLLGKPVSESWNCSGNGCGHTLLTPHSGTLSSKNYPGTYPNHTMCCWRLQAPPGSSLLLAFGDVDLEPSEHCAHSSLLLADPQTGTAYGPYCRNSVPSAPLLVTNSSTVTVLFNSTSHRSGRGLLMSYATSQHPDLISCLVRGTHYTQEYISVYCPAGCKDIHGDIWGNPSQGYRDTSVLCKAAVHAGVIADELGGQVTLSREKGITLYESAFANGLRSKRGSLSEKRLVFHKACDDVLEVVTFNASSWWHEVDVLGQDRAWVAERAALSTTGHSWAAKPGAKAAWLELDLGTRKNVTGIITKGSSEQHDYYVTSYHVSSSRDGKNWRPYRGSSGQEDKVFEGNADSHGEVSNAFIPPIVARYIRVTPQSWHQHIALKVALMGCQLARVRIPRPYEPSVPKEVLEATSHPPSHTPIPGIALDPEKAGSTLLVILLIGGFVLLCSCLLLLAFLCHRKRKSAVELNCGITKGYPKLESSQVCSLQSLPAPSLASFPMAPTPGALSWTHSPEYTEPDLVQANPSSQTGPSTFKPLLEEGYTLPLVLNHYDVPGKHNEYAEPLPPEPEYAMPFTEPEPAGMHRSPCIITGPAECSPGQYQTPALRPGELPAAVEGTGTPCSEESRGWPRHCPLAHVYHEAL